MNYESLTREQKKIIYLGAITFAFILFFWLGIYAPQARRFASIKKKLVEAEGQIAGIKGLAEGRDFALAISGLRARLTNASKALPSEDTVVIYGLSEAARKLNIQVKSITPSAKRLLEGRITGYDVEELPLSMSMVCEYRTLGEYLNILRNNFPVLIRVRQMDIQNRGEGQAGLEITLQIYAYLSREKQGG